ncbi:hypothetical protein [Staphylococcus xylosus]|uniref:hypothetical protein n=1 Tax=Staphylococcus xylosus TaxID=1288 RepID=UPI000D1D1930|nr:hypothetical protein [Staphylococcus xylosus]PTH99284.1 hypothetical protein BU099_05030 [Staphylococcus xylosus]
MWNKNFNTHNFFGDFELKNPKIKTELSKSYASMIAQIVKSYKLPIKENYKEVKEQMARFDSDITRLMIKYKLPIHLDMDISIVRDFDEPLNDQYVQKQLEESLIENFDSYILEKVKGYWKESNILKEREILLGHVLSAYEYKLYGVVAATVTAQIEGILLKALGKEDLSKSELELVMNILFDRYNFLDNITKNYYLKIVVDSYTNDQNNRHCIAHGKVYEYTDKIHAIKAILIFDTIRSQIDQIEDLEILRSIFRQEKSKGNQDNRIEQKLNDLEDQLLTEYEYDENEDLKTIDELGLKLTSKFNISKIENYNNVSKLLNKLGIKSNTISVLKDDKKKNIIIIFNNKSNLYLKMYTKIRN